ncbi:hypothetical protein [Streptomyces sp. AC495_CC817]|uniref:hypothetical protein n=1 Tax=Streptomyces sp. AC495_CC817 TaxID=2823900 RepID=UPI001C260E7F|nr:hypothetical protein [Streptomyces sp. AC495_CC817]
MTDEQLIVRVAQTIDSWLHVYDSNPHAARRPLAENIAAVFEAALTPTNEEREDEHQAQMVAFEGAKIDARNSMRHDPHVWHEALEDALDKVLPAVWHAAAGFRCSVVPEPSADDVEGILDRATLDEYMRVDPNETYESLVVKANALASTVRRLLAAEAQAEPSEVPEPSERDRDLERTIADLGDALADQEGQVDR